MWRETSPSSPQVLPVTSHHILALLWGVYRLGSRDKHRQRSEKLGSSTPSPSTLRKSMPGGRKGSENTPIQLPLPFGWQNQNWDNPKPNTLLCKLSCCLGSRDSCWRNKACVISRAEEVKERLESLPLGNYLQLFISLRALMFTKACHKHRNWLIKLFLPWKSFEARKATPRNVIPGAESTAVDSFDPMPLSPLLYCRTPSSVTQTQSQKFSLAEETSCFGQQNSPSMKQSFNQGLRDVTCSEKYTEFSLLSAAAVKKELVHGSINASPNNKQ